MNEMAVKYIASAISLMWYLRINELTSVVSVEVKHSLLDST